MVMNEHGSNQREGNTGVSTRKALTKNGQASATPKKAAPTTTQTPLLLPSLVSTTTIMTVARSTTLLINTASVIPIGDLPSPTPPPQPQSEPAPPTKQRAQAELPMPNTETPIEKSTEEVVTTSIIDDQQV